MDETTPAGAADTEALSPAEALVALLIAGARADEVVSPHEANLIEDSVAKMKLFRGSTYEARYFIFMTVAARIREQGADHVFREALRRIPKELAATTFALAVDLMLADGRLTPRETGFADELRAALDIDGELAGKIIDVLTIKNAG